MKICGNMDIIVYDKDGNKVEMEVVLMYHYEDKHYIIYRDLDKTNKDYYVSYYKVENGKVNPKLYNDLTEEEYKMLEEVYKKAVDKNV